jgi:hypothetical protein
VKIFNPAISTRARTLIAGIIFFEKLLDIVLVQCYDDDAKRQEVLWKRRLR